MKFKYKLTMFLKKILLNPKEILPYRIWFLIVPILVLIIDRVTKTYLFGPDSPSIDLKVIAINVDYTLNTGAAFGSLKGMTVLLQIFGFLVLIFSIIIFFTKVPNKYLAPIFMIGAGGFGNVIDRFLYPNAAVRDFLTFPWWRNYAIFNFADSCVFIGAMTILLMLIFEIFIKREKFDRS